MGTLRTIALAVLSISFLTFVALFGRLPALRNTPIRTLHRLIWIHFPRIIQAVDQRVSGGRLVPYLSKVGHYLVYEKNPVVLVLFLALLTTSSTLFLIATWTGLSLLHHVIIAVLLPLPYIFTWLSAYSNESQITAGNNARQLRVYPYDHTLYYPGNRCTTCQHLKPARSKHCSICRACIARHDHHCVWVNNCLGQENYRWFLGLLASLSCLLPYGASLAYVILREKSAPKLAVSSRKGLKGVLDRSAIILASDARVGGVGLLAGLTAPLAWGLFGYHVYLIWAGTTTNETMKWEDLKEDMAAGLVYKRARDSRDAHSQRCARTTEEEDKGEDPSSPWPNTSDQIIVRMQHDESPLVEVQSIGEGERGKGGDMVRCWHLGDIVNVYDLGFWDNLLDALYL